MIAYHGKADTTVLHTPAIDDNRLMVSKTGMGFPSIGGSNPPLSV